MAIDQVQSNTKQINIKMTNISIRFVLLTLIILIFINAYYLKYGNMIFLFNNKEQLKLIKEKKSFYD